MVAERPRRRAREHAPLIASAPDRRGEKTCMTSERTTENVNPASLPDRIWATLEQTSKHLDRASRQMAEDRERAAQDRERAAQRRRQADREMARLRASMEDTDRRMKETDRRLKKAEELFTSQWGKLMESLVEGDLAPLLQERGIDVEGTAERSHKRRNGEHMEIDIVAVNGAEVVAVEVKTTLRPDDVRHFLEKLSRFLEWFPEYGGRRLYGAVAYLRSESESAVHAERQGLFVIRATGSSASIVNAPDFKPRAFT